MPKFDFEVPFTENITDDLLALRFRCMSPFIDDKGLGYIDVFSPHPYQYYFRFDNEGKIELWQSELNMEKDWKNVKGIRNQDMRVGGQRAKIIAVGYADYLKDRFAKVEVFAKKGDITLTVNGRVIIDYSSGENYYFSKGFIIFKAYNEDIVIDNFYFEELKKPELIIKNVTPTPMFLKGTPLKWMLNLEVENKSDEELDCYVSVKANMLEQTCKLEKILHGIKNYELFIEDINVETELTFELYEEGMDVCLAKYTNVFKPQRKWDIFVMTSAHEDLGYCGHINKLQDDMAVYLDEAKRLCDISKNDGENERFKYVIEHLWWLFAYENARGSEATKDLIENYIKPGFIEVAVVHSGTHTHWDGYEQLARSTYYAGIECVDRYGIKPKTALYVDVPGVSWSTANVFPKAGIKYMLNCRGLWRHEVEKENLDFDFHNDLEVVWMWQKGARTDIPPVFYWQAPNGKDKILFSHVLSYGDRKMSPMLKRGYSYLKSNITEYLEFQEKNSIDVLIEPIYFDHETPNYGYVDTIKKWNKKWAYPKFRMSNMTDYFEFVEEKYAEKLPVLSGDINDNWADFAANDTNSQALKRWTEAHFPRVETLELLSCIIDNQNSDVCKNEVSYNAGLSYDTMWRLMEFDEHCWATMPTPTFDNVLNNYIINKGNILQAYKNTKSAFEKYIKRLNNCINLENEKNIVVWNFLANPVSEFVNLEVEELRVNHFWVMENGLECKYSFVDENQIRFYAKDVPAFGYKIYELTTADSIAASEKILCDTQKNMYINSISTPFYDIKVDLYKGTIESIYDKKAGREIIDKNAEYGFNQLVYAHADSELTPHKKYFVPQQAEVVIKETDIGIQISINCLEIENKAEIKQTIYFYNESKIIDIRNQCDNLTKLLYEGEIGKCFGDMGNRYLDNFYFAFPFAVEDFTFDLEFAGGVVNSDRDLLALGVTDYRLIQNWVDVSNDKFGVALYTKEAPVINLGEIRYNNLLSQYKPQNSHIYSYAASNRMAGLNTRSLEDINMEFNYSVLPHSGRYNEGQVPEFSLRKLLPLQASIENRNEGTLELKSFISIDKGNVRLIALKPAERNEERLILRLVETNGCNTEVKVSLPVFQLDKVYMANVIEEPQYEIDTLNEHEFKVEVGAFDVVTLELSLKEGIRFIKLVNKPKALEISEIYAYVIDKNNLALVWKSCTSRNISHYEVYRSKNRNFVPSEETFVEKVEASRFYLHFYKDYGLQQNTEYAYKVIAVDNEGNKGSHDETIYARTPDSDWYIKSFLS